MQLKFPRLTIILLALLAALSLFCLARVGGHQVIAAPAAEGYPAPLTPTPEAYPAPVDPTPDAGMWCEEAYLLGLPAPMWCPPTGQLTPTPSMAGTARPQPTPTRPAGMQRRPGNGPKGVPHDRRNPQ